MLFTTIVAKGGSELMVTNTYLHKMVRISKTDQGNQNL